ncbi:hypothetical protein LH53_02105 [Mesotoga sp. TolDC]|nr:hypothetical protein LH53_02105 [Mesotoga sp. TolDC]
MERYLPVYKKNLKGKLLKASIKPWKAERASTSALGRLLHAYPMTSREGSKITSEDLLVEIFDSLG